MVLPKWQKKTGKLEIRLGWALSMRYKKERILRLDPYDMSYQCGQDISEGDMLEIIGNSVFAYVGEETWRGAEIGKRLISRLRGMLRDDLVNEYDRIWDGIVRTEEYYPVGGIVVEGRK